MRLPQTGWLTLPCAQSPTPTSALSARFGTGRPFGVSLGGISGGCSPLGTRRHVVAPLLLGCVSTPRAFSLWGYGKPSTPAAPPDAPATAAATATATTKEPSGQAPAASAAPVDPTPDAPVPAAPPTEPPVSASDVDLSSITDLINAQDILGMPEQLGYLHAIGLDYGWGPTSLMQWALEHVHVWTGLGWAGSIVTTAVLLRCIMFYPQIRALQFGAVMHKMKQDPRSQEAMKLVQQGFQNRDTDMRQRGQILNKILRDQYGASNWGIMWSLMQIPFTFGMFRIVSGMTHVPVPSLETGGFLWFPDLTATDPYFILPAVGTGLMVVSVLVCPAPPLTPPSSPAHWTVSTAQRQARPPLTAEAAQAHDVHLRHRRLLRHHLPLRRREPHDRRRRRLDSRQRRHPQQQPPPPRLWPPHIR